MEKVIGEKIQIITAATPPAGRPPNITGKLYEVNRDIVKLRLQQEKDGPSKERIGVYKLDDIIGFVPVTGEDSGCSDGGKEQKDPLVKELKKLVGKRIEVFTATITPSDTPVSFTGTLIEAEEGYIKMQLDVKDEGTEPEIVVLQTSQIIGYSKVGTPGGGTEPGKVKGQVAIEWQEGVEHPEEVNVTLVREEIETIVRTVEGIAVFITDPAGTVIIKGEDIPGFITPIKEIRLPGKEKFVFETLTYTAKSIPVEGILIDQSEITLIEGETVQLTATIIPPNANNQAITWESSDKDVATVEDGLVTAISKGDVTISVITEEGGKTDTVQIFVLSVTQIINPAQIIAIQNELVTLPTTVTVILSDGSLKTLPVVWKSDTGEEVGTTFKVPEENPEEVYTFIGYVFGTDERAILEIKVEESDEPAVPVTDIKLDKNSVSMYVGDTLKLIATVLPVEATNKAVIWTSTDESIATVVDGTVTAMAPGLAVITAETVDGGYKAYCQISISAVPEIELIYATEAIYDSREEVTINVSNLVEYKKITKETNYYVKVEQSGSSRLLGEGIVTIYPDTVDFNLYNITNFKTTNNYSKEYFVYMSTDPTYPKEDEMTLMTNFKIGSPVPIVPKENIIVNLEIIGGPLERPENVIFILARELDKDIAEITWRDYAINPDAPDDEKEFTDEVKLRGKTDENGLVIWDEPAEPLKLGGYVLLEVTPEGYIDNLNLVNPDSDDGTLLKEVQLTRDDIVERKIINTYIG